MAKGNPESIDYARLSQAEMAAVAGRTATFVRNNPSLFRRAEDGSYSAPRLIEIAIGKASADLPDSLRERCQLACEDVVASWPPRAAGLVELIDQLLEVGGAEEFIRLLLAESKRWAPSYSPPDPAKVRAEAEQAIEHDELADARAKYKALPQCERCYKHRWRGSWKRGPLPEGFTPDPGAECPACSAKAR